MRTFKIWAYSIISLIIIGSGVYLYYFDGKRIISFFNNFFSLLGLLLTVIFYCLCVAIIASTVFGLGYGILFLYKKYNTHEISEIGQYGNVIIRNGKHITIQPLAQKSIAEKTQQEKLPVTTNLPKLRDILANGHLVELLANNQMIFGYKEDGSERLGTWDDVRTCGIWGKSRYGKTVTLYFLAIQCILSHAKVFVCDKHFMKDTSLYRLLSPLNQYVYLAGKHLEIIEAIEQFASELDARINGTSLSRETWVLMIDEFTQISMDKPLMKLLGKVVHRIANEASGYNMYALIGGQSVQASFVGGNALLSSLHAHIVHHFEEHESTKVLGKKYAKLTPKLGRGKTIFKDTSGELDSLYTPLGVSNDAYTVLNLLQTRNVNVYQSPFEYQPTFTNYNPLLLQQRAMKSRYDHSQPNNPTHPIYPNQSIHPTIPLVQQSEQHVTRNLNIEPTTDETISVTMQRLLKDDLLCKDGRTHVNRSEQEKILHAILDTMTEENGKKENGKVNRFVVRDKLQYNNRQYVKIQAVCDLVGL